ncbi:MAG: hypothetical protein HRT61_20545 [Ekhidna sp.]|nr:hypothetical protein [Ekhidna sp.]
MVRINSKILSYPVASISNNWILSFHRSDNDLLIGTKRMLKKEYFDRLKVIDSNGQLYIVEKTQKTGYSGKFWGFDIFLDQKFKIDLFAEEPSNVSFEGLKELILKVYEKREDFWDSDGELGSRKSFMENAKSCKEIISKFTEEYYKQY